MGWTIDIVYSAGTLTLDSNFDFAPRVSKQVTARNVVEYVDVYFDVQGQVVGATPALVAAAFKAIYEQVTIRLQPVTVTIKLDGVEQFAFTPGASKAGPTILEMEAPKEDGNGGSKWAYSFTIFVRLPGNNFAGLHDLHTRLTVVRNESGVVVTKIWEAVGRATTIATALAGVKRFKPSGRVSEEITESFDPDPTASATWVWRRTTLTHLETISILGGGKSYEIDPQAGVNVAPLLHLARRGAWIIRLDGVVRGLETDKIVAPPAHWKETATMKRMEALEVKSFPTRTSQEDADLGHLSLSYSEVWVCTAATVPAPNHGSHALTKNLEREPADGAIAR